MNTLALSTKVQNGVKPPAKKHEVIAAMATVKHEQLRAEQEKLNAERDQAEKDAKAALEAYAAQNVASTNLDSRIGCLSCGGNVHDLRVYLDLTFENLPKSLQKIIKKAHVAKDAARNHRVPDFHSLKCQIAAQMQGETQPALRVQALIETPETRKAIEKMLAALDAKKEPATINV